MYEIVRKERLTPTISLIEIKAPMISERAEPGQFIILRVDENGERVPFTINDFDRENGTITIIYQLIGYSTYKMNTLEAGDFIYDIAGPLGVATHCEGFKKVAVVGGGVGNAIAFPIARKLHQLGCEVHAITGFKNKDVVILENEYANASSKHIVCTDDGSHGRKGLVTEILKELIEEGNEYDQVIAIGPMPMMKFVSLTTKPYGVKTIVSLCPLMVDGTGMCGCCRVVVGGETKFACVDGPDFDGHLVDWDTAIQRGKIYGDFEREIREANCNLLNAEVK